jgi:hypothetical protein
MDFAICNRRHAIVELKLPIAKRIDVNLLLIYLKIIRMYLNSLCRCHFKRINPYFSANLKKFIYFEKNARKF